jgi:hypothetical protein
MVRLTSPRSFSLSVAAAAAAAVTGSTEITWGAASTSTLRLAPPSRRNGWTSRAVRDRDRAHSHSHLGHDGLIAAHHSVTAGDHTSLNNSLDSPPESDGRPYSHHAHSIDATREPSSVHVLVITCSAVGGVIALVAILAIVYIRRIRRKVKRMKRCTNVLGPGAAHSFGLRSQSLPVLLYDLLNLACMHAHSLLLFLKKKIL